MIRLYLALVEAFFVLASLKPISKLVVVDAHWPVRSPAWWDKRNGYPMFECHANFKTSPLAVLSLCLAKRAWQHKRWVQAGNNFQLLVRLNTISGKRRACIRATMFLGTMGTNTTGCGDRRSYFAPSKKNGRANISQSVCCYRMAHRTRFENMAQGRLGARASLLLSRRHLLFLLSDAHDLRSVFLACS